MRRRNVLIAASAVVVLLAAGISVLVVNGEHTPEQAVRDYVTLIADGDGAAANSLVDPRGKADPAVLAAALGSATAHITIDSIESADQSSDTTTVEVRYSLLGHPGEASLRVRRAPSEFGVLTRWQVVDPLLVPVTVAANTTAFTAARLGDAEVPSTGKPVLLYPGEYQLAGHPSANLDSTPSQALVVTTNGATSVSLSVAYQPSGALRQLVLSRTTQYLQSCTAAGANMAPNCPAGLLAYADFARNLSVTGQPTLATFGAAAVPGTAPRFLFQTTAMRFTYTDATGASSAELTVLGYADVSAEDTATVTFLRDVP